MRMNTFYLVFECLRYVLCSRLR